jgi:hypothetical protein
VRPAPGLALPFVAPLRYAPPASNSPPKRGELAAALDAEPTIPEAATLAEVADHITSVIDSGTHQTRKALIETLIAEVKITSPSTLVPVFRIPQQRADEATTNTNKALTSGKPPARATKGSVRAMTNLERVTGIEPALWAWESRCGWRDLGC